MTKIASWLLLGLIFVVTLGLFVPQLLSGLTEKQRLAAVASVKKPEAVAFYEQLAAEEAKPAAAVEPATPQDDDTALSDREIMERWARLFERVRKQLDKNAEWNALWELYVATPVRDWPDEERRQAEAFVTGLADLLDEIRELAALGGPVVSLDMSDYWGPTRHCSSLVLCVELLRFDAGVLGARGNRKGAAENIFVILQLGDVLAGEPFVESQDFRKSIIWRANLAFVWTFEPGELPSEFVAPLQDQLARARRRDILAATMAAHFHRRVEERRASWSGRSLSACVNDEGLLEGATGWPWVGPVCKPLFNQDEQIFAELTNRLVDAARMPYYEARPILERTKAEVDAMSFVRSYAKGAVPRLMRQINWQAIHESRIDLMQLGIAVEAHHAEHGVYPATLGEIAAHFPDGLPVDPFTGEPFHYTPGENAFLLYGVGHDGEDDGGDRADYNDMVWRAN